MTRGNEVLLIMYLRRERRSMGYGLFFLLTSVVPAGQPIDGRLYHALVERANAGDMSIDFRQLRLACIAANDCDPRGRKKDLAALGLAQENHVLSAVVETGEKLVREGFVNPDAHLALSQVYETMNQPAKAKLHRDVAVELMRSIMNSGDGKTKETAFEVITDREEYFVMTALRLPYLGRSNLVVPFQGGGHRYEKREVRDAKTFRPVRDPQTGAAVVVYFNVDAFSPTKSTAARED